MSPRSGVRPRAGIERRLAAAVAMLVVVATSASAAEVTLLNAWMRPAPAGAAHAKAYVDIISDRTVRLTGASTPAATRVELVRVRNRDTTVDESVVRSFAIKAGATTRLAYNGDHLRLSGIRHDIGNGMPVPLTLTFKDASGKTLRATTDVLVRGLLRPGRVVDNGKGVRRPAPAPTAAPSPPPAPPKL